MSNDSLKELQDVLKLLADEGKKAEGVECFDQLLDCLRTLRKSVACDKENAQLILDFFGDNSRLQDLHAACNGASNPLCTRVFMQILANSLVQDLLIQDSLQHTLQDMCLEELKGSSDDKTKNVISSVLLSLMRQTKGLATFSPCVPLWLESLEGPDGTSDFAFLCLKYLIQHLPINQLTEHKQEIYKLILDLEAVEDMHRESLEDIVNDFTFLTDTILTTTLGSVDGLKPNEIMNLLDILTTASNTKHRALLQGKKSLLINTVYLLRMVHDAGKNNINDFKPVGRLSELAELEKSESTPLEDHPVYKFKVKLIRLLVNLVWEHHENKSLVAEIEGLQLILDCCNIDGKNPFITQWAIMTIKALCDDHKQNQETLLGLRRQGAADEKLLNELGISLKRNEGQ